MEFVTRPFKRLHQVAGTTGQLIVTLARLKTKERSWWPAATRPME